MYVWHFVIVDVLHRALIPDFLQWKEVSLIGVYVSVVTVTAAISGFSEKWIEARGIKAGKKMIATMS